MICENCGHEIPEDRIHHADPYEKGVCQTFSVVNGAQGLPTGWTRNRKTIDFNAPNVEGRKQVYPK